MDTLGARVHGRRGGLLGLALKTAFLTVATLGLYSFWARTRVRRWLWSSLHVGEAPLEYTGRPVEKLMGFVMAACIVATYLGVVVMLLIFASFTFFNELQPGIVASVVLILPVYWFARYRGQRYLLNHTRWRGLSFSMVPGAWGYSGRAVWWTILTLATAGLALPWRTHRLWAYRLDRTFYGDTRFRGPASAWPLARMWLPTWLALAACIAGIGALSYWGNNAGTVGWAILWSFALVIVIVWLWVRWRVRSFTRLVADTGWGPDVALRVAPRTGRVIAIHLLGWLAVAFLLLVVVFVGLGVFGGVAVSSIDFERLEESLTGATAFSPYVLLVTGLMIYLSVFLLRGAFRMAFVTFPLIGHVGDTLVVSNAATVGAAERGTRQHMADADGFANLFDLGAGI